MGTPAYAVPTLEALHAQGWPVVGVVCQPDKPSGRGQTLTPPPVKVAAERLGLPVLQPARLRGNEEALAEARALRPDLAVVIAYGKILPPNWLALPPRGCLNLHGSLLPAYRGAAPIQWALIRGETRTGVTLMLMDEGMDTGPMLAKAMCDVAPDDDAATLFGRLAALSADLLLAELPRWLAGELRPEPQDEALATMAPMLRKETGALDWRLPARDLVNLARGVQPWPGAAASLSGQALKLRGLQAAEAGTEAAPGTLVALEPEGWRVACGQGSVLVREVQVPGKPMRAAADVARGWRELKPGLTFDLPPVAAPHA